MLKFGGSPCLLSGRKVKLEGSLRDKTNESRKAVSENKKQKRFADGTRLTDPGKTELTQESIETPAATRASRTR